MLPKTMTVIEAKAAGGPEVLVPGTRPVPVPGPGEILIAVKAAGINRPDVLQRQGLYPAPKGVSDILGMEVAGQVVALGQGATRFKEGASVCALVTGGGYAEFCTAPGATTLPVPPPLTLVEAAALPEAVFTVWHNVFERGGLKSGDWLLVHGGASGIGTTAIQIAAALGAHAMVTVGSEAKVKACEALGAARAVNYQAEDFVEAVRDETGGHGADVILDMVGGDYIERNYEAAAVEGRIVQIAFQDSPKATVNFTRIMLKRLHHTGSTLRSRPNPDKTAIARAVEAKVWPLIAAGKVRPVMDMTFRLTEAAAAHTRIESSQHVGKIVLVV
jgi:NADPH2:quinone reductase